MNDITKTCEVFTMHSMSPRGLHSRQQGIALFVCLMILLVLSILGISAMRMSMSQSQIASSSLASDMAFQAAETAIAKAITEGEVPAELNTREVLPTSFENPIVRCVTADGETTTSTVGACPVSTYSDTKGVTKASVVISTTDPDDPLLAARNLRARVQFGSVPGAVIESFVFTATGSVDALGIRSVNVQETIYPHL